MLFQTMIVVGSCDLSEPNSTLESTAPNTASGGQQLTHFNVIRGRRRRQDAGPVAEPATAGGNHQAQYPGGTMQARTPIARRAKPWQPNGFSRLGSSRLHARLRTLRDAPPDPDSHSSVVGVSGCDRCSRRHGWASVDTDLGSRPTHRWRVVSPHLVPTARDQPADRRRDRYEELRRRRPAEARL
jgi:hypothetical protein